MKAIVQRSTAIVTFVGLLGLVLSAPQRQHVERFGDLLVVAPRRKTLAQLAALELPGVDPSNLADFFRISPWDPDDLRLPLLEFIIDYLKGRNSGDPTCPIFLTIDDSLSAKDKGTCRLQSVDWHFDHNSKQTIKAGSHVVLRIHWGPFHFPLSWRLYLRASTVRRLNRRRKNTKLRYRSKLELAREMLQQVVSLLPQTNPVYVLFDSWYTSAQLVKWIRQQGWHVITAIKSNRKVSGWKLTDWHRCFKGHSYDRVSLELANGQKRTYCVRKLLGRLRGVPGVVRVLLSQKGPGVRTPRCFLIHEPGEAVPLEGRRTGGLTPRRSPRRTVSPGSCMSTDTKLSAQEILKRYQHRWAQEVDYWYVKLQLGLGDFRLHSHEAIGKWYAVVYLVLVYLYWQRYETPGASGKTTSLSEVLARLREGHQRAVLRAACEEAANGTPVEQVLERYLGSAKIPAA